MTVDDWWLQLWRPFRSCKYGMFFSLYLLYHLTLVINEAELSSLFDTRPPSSLAKLPHKSSGRE